MESTIVKIIDALSEPASLVEGVTKLDKLLFSLIPSIGNKSSTKLIQFAQLQDNFEYNISIHLVNYYKDQRDEELTLTCNRLLQGLLLLHPKSRAIFNRSSNMKLVLLCLEKADTFKLEISFISTLIHILLKDLKNFRVFEQQNGCSILIRKFKLNSLEDLPVKRARSAVLTQQNLNYKIIEFLIFYLVDEGDLEGEKKSRLEKSSLFKDDFPEIDTLIENLNELEL